MGNICENYFKSIQRMKNQLFAKIQEAARKDVERAFGVLQARFAIVCGPARIWDTKTLANIMKGCIIMHNMIIEDEGGTGDVNFDEISLHPIEAVSHGHSTMVYE